MEVIIANKTDVEKDMCRLYGSKKYTLNDVRFDMFEYKQKKGVMIDLSDLPPSQSAIRTWREQTMWKDCGSLPKFQC